MPEKAAENVRKSEGQARDKSAEFFAKKSAVIWEICLLKTALYQRKSALCSACGDGAESAFETAQSVALCIAYSNAG